MRSLGPALGWCAATVTSIVLASVAMLPVLRTATPDDGALVSADQLRDSGEAAPIPLPSAPSPSITVPTGEPSATTPPSRTRSPEPAPTSAQTRSPAPEPETTVQDGWTVTTDGDGQKTYLRSFRVDGGQTVIRIAGGRVQLVTATPNDGFEVATVQNSPDSLAVYFNEPNHSFIVHAVWNVDRPVAQVNEIGG